jgi:hypothetical protein
MGFATTNGLSCAGVDAEFEVQDWFTDTSGVEAIPVVLNNGYDIVASGYGDIWVDVEVLLKLLGIPSIVPMVDICRVAILNKVGLTFAHGPAIAFEQENAVVNVVAVVQRYVSVSRFRPPYFGRNFDDK